MTCDLRARPSVEMGVVDVQQLRTFYDLWSACATLPSAEIGVVDVQKLRAFCDL